MRYGDYEPKATDPYKVPEIVADRDKPTSWVEVDSRQPLTFRALAQSQQMTLVPLYQIIDERYAVYWKLNARSV
jgi:hypothetical protein